MASEKVGLFFGPVNSGRELPLKAARKGPNSTLVLAGAWKGDKEPGVSKFAFTKGAMQLPTVLSEHGSIIAGQRLAILITAC